MKLLKKYHKVFQYINEHQYEIAIGLVSILALIVGIFAVGFLKALIIILILDGILFSPNLINLINNISKKNMEVTMEKKRTEARHARTGHAKKTDYTKGANVASTRSARMARNKKGTTKGKNKKKKIGKKVLMVLLILGIIALVAFGIFMFFIIKEAPEFSPDKLYHQEASILYSSDGSVIKKLGSENREKISYDQLPEVLVDAIVATEDSRFFQHNGFDLPRFMRAGFGTLLGKNAGGASTLTMQIAKNHFTSTNRSITRKFTDIYMSIFQIEKHYTKEEIMEFYVNAPYLGSGAWGVEQACLTYFGKSAKDINLAEAAMIAGMFQAPNTYDPNINPDLTEKRRQTVLYLMKRHNYIDDTEYKAALNLSVDKIVKSVSTEDGEQTDRFKYQSFIDAVVEDVTERTGNNPYNVSMQIYTTMDKDKQEAVEDIMNGKTFKWENDVVQGAVAVVDVKTGALTAISNGRNISGANQLGRATKVKRQIGSTAKPIYDYGPGFEYQGWSTATPFADEPHSYSGTDTDDGGIENWNRTYQGWMTLRTALAESRNIPALKAFQQNKNSDIKNFAESLGLHPQIENGMVYESHALGGYDGEAPLTMAGAYAAFANGGYYTKPYTYTKIVYREDDKTEEVDAEKKKVMSPETAYMISNVLYNAADYGIGTSYLNGVHFGAKTGTSNFTEDLIKKKGYPSNAVNDLWVDGINTQYAISVWYGYDKQDDKYVSTTNTGGHRNLFKAIAGNFFTDKAEFTKPDGVVSVEVERETYPVKLPSANTPANMRITELFKKGTEPTEVSSRFAQLSDVSNAKSSISGNSVSISWNGIKTPAELDSGSLSSWIGKVFTDSGYKNSYLQSRLGQNQSMLGSVGYNIYAKQKDGSLRLIQFTNNTSITFTAKSTDSGTYIVKSCYSNFKAAEAPGVETTVNVSNVQGEITVSLVGSASMTVNLNSTYRDQGVVVKEDGKDVSTSAEVETSITNSAGIPASLDTFTSTAGTYTISYTVTYGDYTKTITRKVTVVDNQTGGGTPTE